MKDLTLKIYKRLIKSLKDNGYIFTTDINILHKNKSIMMRHDVDSWPINALKMARMERELGVKSIYYFRKKRISLNIGYLKQIADLGHEIGYHYEDLCDTRGNINKAFIRFTENLAFLRKLVSIKSIAMHGRPLSKWDSKDIWKKYNYKELNIDFEPYLDIDYTKVAYLTDTGGCWDGGKYSVRDNVSSIFDIPAHSTEQLIGLINNNKLPNNILINVHPARWNDNMINWLIRKYVLTLPKLQAKKILKRFRS